jgi:tetratricopeptide (TPR) repeat protein
VVFPLRAWCADPPIRIPGPGEGYEIARTDSSRPAPSGYEGRTDIATLTAVGNTPATKGKRIVARFTLGNQIVGWLVARGSRRRLTLCYTCARASGIQPVTPLAQPRRVRAFEDLSLSGHLDNLAVVYKFWGKFDQAEGLYWRALAITQQHLGTDCIEVAAIYHNPGGLEHARGRYARGETYARKSLELRMRSSGGDVRETAADLAALAGLLDAQGKDAEAERLYEQALSIFERALGQDHYEVAVSLDNLAAIHFSRGNTMLAEAYYWWALNNKKRTLGDDHPDVAMTLNNMAVMFTAQGKLDEAEQMHKSALTIVVRALDPSHPHISTCAENYAELLRDRGRDEEADALDAQYRRSDD